MEEPPDDPPRHYGIGQFFDTEKYSDLIVAIPGIPTKRFWCHKTILAAGSSAFAAYFEQHFEEDDAHEDYDIVDINKVCSFYHEAEFGTAAGSVAGSVALAVVRYIYQLPLLDASAQRDHETDRHLKIGFWKDLTCDAVGFGTPRLAEHAQSKYEAILKGMLIDGNIPEFVRQVEAMCGWIERFGKSKPTLSPAENVVARLCRKHFIELREHESFNDFASRHPQFLLSILDHVASYGGEDFR